MFKVCIGIFTACIFLLISCQASAVADCENHNDPQDAQVETPIVFTPAERAARAHVTPLRLGKEVTEISPYVMSTYGFEKLAASGGLFISLFTANYESMLFEDENLVVAVLFVSRGDSDEIPLAFYI